MGGVPNCPAQVSDSDSGKSLDRVVCRDVVDRVRDLQAEPAHGLLGDSGHQRGLAAEVAERCAGGDAGSLRDFAHAHVLRAALLDELNRSIDQRLPQIAVVIAGGARRLGFRHHVPLFRGVARRILTRSREQCNHRLQAWQGHVSSDYRRKGLRSSRHPNSSGENDHARPKRRTQPSAVIHVAPDPCRETAAHRTRPGRRGCLQRHALSACLRRRGGERAHSPGQRGQTQRTHPDHRSDAASCAVRRGHGARPDHRPVPCVWAARRALRYGRVHRQLHCTGEPGGRGSGDQSRVLETSGDGYHRPEGRAARDISHHQLVCFFCLARSRS